MDAGHGPGAMAMAMATATAGGATRQLGHLETILQQLTRHETRTTTESVERTSAVTQLRLLKDQLLRAQEELAAAQASKAGLCEEVGALQQTAERQQKELAQYKNDATAARESQDALVRKVAELEEATRTMKRQYIRSLDCRMKTAAQLLAKIQLGSGSMPGQAADMAQELTAKCTAWVASDANKKKRRHAEDTSESKSEDGPQAPTLVADEDNNVSSLLEPATATIAPCVVDKQAPKCEECAQAKTKHLEEIAVLQAKLVRLEDAHSSLQDQYKNLADANGLAKEADKAHAALLQDRNTEIELLKKQLATLTDKPEGGAALHGQLGSGQATLELESQVKLLEDNLNQMNSYADQLELVIGQCPSCTIKLQNESTQDSVTKNP